jgi:putative mRNA 3-end processing factor
MPDPVNLVTLRDAGLYCEAGDFYIDPWRPVARAVITHAHADHARPGHERYLAAREGEKVLRVRLGPQAAIETVPYGEPIFMNGVRISLHPAGHVLGSAQVRIEHGGEVWVVSGDYRVEPDVTCAPFESVRCDAFITESTFGLPVYRWRPQAALFAEIEEWWRANQQAEKASVLFAYAFGKAQRILAGIDASVGPIVVHGAVEPLTQAYRESGVKLPTTLRVSELEKGFDFSRALIIAPPSAQGTPWLKRFGDYSDAFASGWMLIRGARRRRAVDRGFALSDHADWPGLVSAIEATGAHRIFVTHGQVPVMVRWLAERGYDARALETRFEGEQDGGETSPEDTDAVEGPVQ